MLESHCLILLSFISRLFSSVIYYLLLYFLARFCFTVVVNFVESFLRNKLRISSLFRLH